MFLDLVNNKAHSSLIGLYLDKVQSLLWKGKVKLSFFGESFKERKILKYQDT